jgi:hypothetical protein
VITVPPPSGPWSGVTAESVGTFVYVKDCAPEAPNGVVTTTFTAPAARAGIKQLAEVWFVTVTGVHAAPPTLTVIPATNDDPESFSKYPPAVGPATGLTDFSSGALL